MLHHKIIDKNGIILYIFSYIHIQISAEPWRALGSSTVSSFITLYVGFRLEYLSSYFDIQLSNMFILVTIYSMVIWLETLAILLCWSLLLQPHNCNYYIEVKANMSSCFLLVGKRYFSLKKSGEVLMSGRTFSEKCDFITYCNLNSCSMFLYHKAELKIRNICNRN
jgi:hypothetical protein